MADKLTNTDMLITGYQKINDLITEFNNTVISGDSSVEAAQARVDADGVDHTTLKERLDTEHEDHATQLADNTNVLKDIALNVKTPFKKTLTPAIGDGIIDDTVAIQEAINYCSANSIPLYLPTGIYKVTELVIDGDLTMFGSTYDTSIIHYIGTDTCIVAGDNVASGNRISVTLHDFKVTGDEIDDRVNRTALSGITITRVTGRFWRLKVEYFKNSAFNIWGKVDDPNQPGNSGYNNIYHKLFFKRCGEGFNIKAVVSDSYFSEGQMNWIDDYGFFFHTYNPGWNVNIDKYTCVYSRKAIYAEDVIMRNVSIRGCNLEQFSENGIYIKGYNPDGVDGGTIANNLFYSQNLGTEESLKGDYMDSFVIHSNSFYNNTLYDIILLNTSTKNTVFGSSAINKNLSTNISKTNTHFDYGYTVGQDVTRFSRGLSAQMGDFVTEQDGKGVIVKTPDGTDSYRIGVDNAGNIISTLV